MTPPAPRAGEYGRLLRLTEGHGTSEIYEEMRDLRTALAETRGLVRDLTTALETRNTALAEIAAAGDAALRETGHRVGCPVNAQLGCACGATEAFKPLRAEFYRLLTTHAAAIRGAK